MSTLDSKYITRSSAFKNVFLEFIKWAIQESKTESNNSDPNIYFCWKEDHNFINYVSKISDIAIKEKQSQSIFYDALFQYTPPEPLEVQIAHVLETFINYIFVIVQKEHPSPNADEIFKRFLRRIEEGSHEVTYFPIFNLDFKSGPSTLPLIITDGIEVSGVTSEIIALFKDQLTDRYEVFSNYSTPKLVIKVSKQKLNEKNILSELVQSIPILLYGLYNIYAEIPMYFQGTVSPWHAWKYNKSAGPLKENSNQLPCNQISGEEFDYFTKYLMATPSTEIKKYSIAYKRIINSFKRENYEKEDRVIDVAIAFESLFQGNENIGFRLSTIPSLVLKDKLEDRQILSSLIKDFYKYRSYIVHGESKEKRKNIFFTCNAIDTNLYTIISTIQSLLRLILLNPVLRTEAGHKVLILNKEINLCKDIDSYLKLIQPIYPK